ncbi:ABC transporter ATP-binding protein [Pelagibius litoralis]|uniref:ABC transporter ATP-binding protein n=1 Tax=Pelagibius litoralis TaxID=374515 RepID=UPI001F1171B3|nr:ABC transporter ATP-binding protein [Pelagibius litoralis]
MSDKNKNPKRKIDFKDESTKVLVRRLVRDYVAEHKVRIAFALIGMAIVAATTAGFTQLIKPVVNDIFGERRADLLVPIALTTIAVFTLRGFAAYAQAVLMSIVGHRVVAKIQQQLFDSLIGADLAFFHHNAPGALVSRFINDVNLLRNTTSNTLTAIGKDSLTAAALIGVMFYEDWLLAMITTVILPIAILPSVRVGRSMRKVSGKNQVQVGRLTTLLDEAFQGIRHVKSYVMERYESKRAREAIEEVFELNMKSARVSNTLHPIMEALGGFAIAAVILYGGNEVIAGNRQPGSLFAFIFALLLAYEPLKRMSKLNGMLQNGLAAAQRVFEVLDRQPEIRDPADAREIAISGGTVRFEAVHFSYDGAKAALHGINLEAPAGKTVALVGPSGAGKSTILNLIPRFYDPEQGKVTIDSQDLRDVTLDSLRRSIALVSQEILLFDDTLRANIAYGRPGASAEEIENAALLAGAHGFIKELTEGYETQVGPRGSNLSGGQRQRVAIARAILKDAPILLLDEATSALDSESERHVQAALNKLISGRTTFVIAHRLSTVVDADIIYVMDKGRIVEQGTHRELLARNGHYARLYALQFAQQEPAGPAEEVPGNDLRVQA